MDIVEELRTDRETGARRLEAEYKAGLMSLALRFCNDPGDAEELVNSTFATVVENIDNYIEQSAFFAWMCQILTSKVSRNTRRKSNQMEVLPDVMPEAVDEDGGNAIYRELDASLLREAIDTLSPDIRKTLLMHYFMDFSVKDVARMLAVPSGTVVWRLHYARQILASKLGAAAKKPGTKALLLALALCVTAALGAAGIARWGEPSRRAAGEGAFSERAALSEPSRPSGPSEPSKPSDAPPSIFGFGLSTFDQPTQKQPMNATTRSAALGAATALALSAAPPATSADGYQYIVSGDPIANATVGVVSGDSPNGPLDMREHAFAESATMALASVKANPMVILFK